MKEKRNSVEIDLWPENNLPYSIEHNVSEYEDEIFDFRCLRNVVNPTLTIYPAADIKSNKAVLVIPGGGYELVAIYHEGYEIAEQLAEQGITAGVLKYRLPDPKTASEPYRVPLADAREGLKRLRMHSAQLGFQENQVGVLGFSAGGHLAATLALWLESNSAEIPAFTALVYGADLSRNTSDWLQNNLFHREINQDEMNRLNLAGLVTSTTPPGFIVHGYDDEMVSVKESEAYAQSLRKHGVPVETHLFQNGGHGYGAGNKKDGTDVWLSLFTSWLTRLEL